MCFSFASASCLPPRSITPRRCGSTRFVSPRPHRSFWSGRKSICAVVRPTLSFSRSPSRSRLHANKANGQRKSMGRVRTSNVRRWRRRISKKRSMPLFWPPWHRHHRNARASSAVVPEVTNRSFFYQFNSQWCEPNRINVCRLILIVSYYTGQYVFERASLSLSLFYTYQECSYIFLYIRCDTSLSLSFFFLSVVIDVVFLIHSDDKYLFETCLPLIANAGRQARVITRLIAWMHTGKYFYKSWKNLCAAIWRFFFFWFISFSIHDGTTSIECSRLECGWLGLWNWCERHYHRGSDHWNK